MVALAGRTTEAAALVAEVATAAARTTEVAALVTYAPPSALAALTTEVAALLAKSGGNTVSARTTEVAALVAYSTGTPGQSRSRAWTFTLDGHTFYVLNLGAEGTFLFDVGTRQWFNCYTLGYGQWNMLNGTMWGSRIVGGDSILPVVWELDPNAVLDEEWRDIQHAVTGGVQTRSRVAVSCDALRLAASVGTIDEVDGATLNLRFSDDNGKTWSDYFSIELTQGDYSGELAWRSLGSFAMPGRIFEISDIGGLIRIDGCDAFLGGFENDAQDGR